MTVGFAGIKADQPQFDLDGLKVCFLLAFETKPIFYVHVYKIYLVIFSSASNTLCFQ